MFFRIAREKRFIIDNTLERNSDKTLFVIEMNRILKWTEEVM